jgi:choline dehydrogenase-like flavoprotein
MLLPEASSSHYAGTVPQSDDDRIPLTTDARGKVRRMQRTWVADAAVFPCLPAKPHTLTIMANARRIALEALRTLD